MRVVGALLCVMGAGLTALCVRRAFASPRPRDVAWAALGPVAVLAYVLGVILLFVPGFL